MFTRNAKRRILLNCVMNKAKRTSGYKLNTSRYYPLLTSREKLYKYLPECEPKFLCVFAPWLYRHSDDEAARFFILLHNLSAPWDGDTISTNDPLHVLLYLNKTGSGNIDWALQEAEGNDPEVVEAKKEARELSKLAKDIVAEFRRHTISAR